MSDTSNTSKPLSSNATRKVALLVAQMQRAFQQQHWELCEQLCIQIEAWQPNNAETATVRGIVAAQSGDSRSAEHYFVNAVNEDPQRESFQLNLGSLYLEQGLPQDALPRFQAAQQINPKNLVAILGAGQCLLQLNEHQQAYDVFKQGQIIYPASDDVDMALFRASFQLNQLDESEQYVQAVLTRNPEHAEAHLAMGQIALQRGHFEQAEKETLQCIMLNPSLDFAYPILAAIKTFSHADQPLIEQIQKHRQAVEKDSFSYINLSFTLGKIMEDLGEHSESFKYIAKANEIRRQHTNYDHNTELEHLEAIPTTYDQRFVSIVNKLDTAITPVFIVGMPRCGSTLVEQIIAAHPEVEGMGGCGFFEASLAQFHSQASPLTLTKIESLSLEQWGEIGQDYLQRIHARFPEAHYVTDKSLTNIRLIGAIRKALPHAKFIHVRRDPMDTCWSIFKNHFTSHAFDYAYSLSEIAYYYRAYQQLMAHWQAVLPSSCWYALDYEELVQHQDIGILELLNACGLTSHDDCFQFHQAQHFSISANQAQVRKPMQSQSIGAWKNYENELEPLKQILSR